MAAPSATATVEPYRAGALGSVARMHGEYYAKHWGLARTFECQVARGLADLLERADSGRDGFWTVAVDGEIVGSIAIDGHGDPAEGARLRFFLVDESRQRLGIGRLLVGEALAFCERAGHRRVFLWTFAGLDAARALYERNGFRLVDERSDARWGVALTEQKFVREG